MAEGIIYMYTSPKGKSYIGKTLDEKTRIKSHRIKTNGGSNYHIHRAMRKYGYENMEYRIIVRVCAKRDVLNKQLCKLEMYYINKYNTFKCGYNMSKGGDGPIGYKHPSEMIKHLSEYRKQNLASHIGLTGKENHMYGKRGKKCPNWGRKGRKNSNSIQLLDLITGILYENTRDMVEKTGYKKTNIGAWVSGQGSRAFEVIKYAAPLVTKSQLVELQQEMAAKKEERERQKILGRSLLRSKPVLDTETKEKYKSTRALANKLNKPESTVNNWLTGKVKSVTRYKYIEV